MQMEPTKMLSREIIDMLAECRQNGPQKTAIETKGHFISYAELEQKSNEVADLLFACGVAKRSVIVTLMEDISELVAAVIGILKADCVFVPIDPRYPVNRIQAMVGTAEPQAFLVQRKFTKIAAESAAKNGLNSSILVAEERPVALDPRRGEGGAGSNECLPHMGYIYFTSGSTGQPKGIAGNLRGLSHFINWEAKALGVDRDFRISQLTPPSFDPFLRDIFLPLCTGGTLCIPPDRETVLDSEKLVNWIDHNRITLMHCTPSLFRSLLNQPLNPHHFQSLRFIVLAGEPLFPSDIKKWFRVFGDRIQLVNLYGPTETTLAKFCYFVCRSDQERRIIPVGKPIAGTEAFVLNGNHEPCPDGAAGEIHIRTVYRSYGYYRRPELTREVFIQNPLNPDDSDDLIYRTGDIGRILPDGNFELLGRKDNQVKIRGARVELGEIENLLRDHPAVADAAVKDWDDDHHQKFLCAYIVSNEDPDTLALQHFLSRWLPEHSVPSIFMRIEELPLNLNGKMDRRALPDPRTRMRDDSEYAVPRNNLERKIAEIWQAVLEIPRVGIYDTFFSLGGHSLMATRLIAQLRQEFQIQIPLRLLFEHPTVAGLAAALKEKVPLRPECESVDSPPELSLPGAESHPGPYVVPSTASAGGEAAVL